MQQQTILANANLLDGDAPARKANLVVSGDRIESISEGPIAAGLGDRCIDLAGRTVMPGMIVGHYHATYRQLGAVPAPLGLDAPPALHAARAVRNLELTLQCGFTGAISAGAPFAVDASMKLAIEEGTVLGPRLVPCGSDLGTTGHFNDLGFRWYWDIRAHGGVRACDGPEEFRKGVREEIKAGAEIIKMFVTGGHGVPAPSGRVETAPDELAAAIDAAHQRQALIRGHIANRDTVLLALDLGMDIIDHGDGFDEACIERILKTRAALAPSLLFADALLTANPRAAYAAAMKPDFDQMASILPKANAAGVRIILGDDYGAMGLDHGRYAEELALYVNKIGIPPLDVIRWATRYGAEAMGRADELGTLAPGKLADLLIVDGDPIADITILQDRDRLLGVMKGGVFAKDALGDLVGASETSQASRVHLAAH